MELAPKVPQGEGTPSESNHAIRLGIEVHNRALASAGPASVVVLWCCTLEKRVRASQAKTPYGIRSLARDCDSPLPTANLP